MKVRVRARVKNRRFPAIWGRPDFRGEAETEFEVPDELLKPLKASGWLVDPSVVPDPSPPPAAPALPPRPDPLAPSDPPEEP